MTDPIVAQVDEKTLSKNEATSHLGVVLQPSVASLAASQPGIASLVSSQPSMASLAASQPSIASLVLSQPSMASLAASQPGIASLVSSQPSMASLLASSLTLASPFNSDVAWKSSLFSAAPTIAGLESDPTKLVLARASALRAAPSTVKALELDEEKSKLKRQIAVLTKDREESEIQALQLQSDFDALEAINRLQHLVSRVGEPARVALLNGPMLKQKFDENETSEAYVVSIDLRRSTELMLKARTPRLFAEFITSLANKLRTVILDRFGVFDKFTGDGILAFFPAFYSGVQAGLLAVDAAKECHEVFASHYRAHRTSFTSVLKNVGLGIGIDFGLVSIVQMSNELTVVGSPVVYACRLGGADAGQTLVNQPAYEQLLNLFSEFIDFSETEIVFKHEGAMVAYRVIRNEKQFELQLPCWCLEVPAIPPNSCDESDDTLSPEK